MQLDIAMKKTPEFIFSGARNLCQPFFNETGLNSFSYSRLFMDGTRSEVWSDAGAFEHTFHKARYIVGAYTPQYFEQRERYSILDRKVETYPAHLRTRYRQQLADQRDYFDYDHCFAILNQNHAFSEYFIFYAPRSNVMALNFYLNNFDRLENFSSYFLQAAAGLIEQADQYRIHRSVNPPPVATSIEALVQRPFPGEKTMFTPREDDVARLLVTGATAKEIGNTLGISHRTVESHLEHMKQKLGCTKKSMLVKELLAKQHAHYLMHQ
ncbi:response regulator transcription factor [Ralstonia nicotianae]|uniref:helix-turn-helix transcriptional regulator n=1 Tax=Ralstonia pseudosolanacearum TaxID=1310165 RepID=UPI003C1BFFA5